MKSLVVYSTQTGNTKALAYAVYESLPDDKEISFVGDAPDPGEYDFVAVGFWLMAGKPDPKAAEYLEKIKAEETVSGRPIFDPTPFINPTRLSDTEAGGLFGSRI